MSLVAVFLLALYWPFRLAAVVKELEEESDTKVTVGSFHGHLLPPPGLCPGDESFSSTIQNQELRR